mmetsp:Transcript_16891/g.47142  ORF Transcript_16891/g.47142 Transcript_16891/m.47142 type:complete len:413 (+) Transcript_16891:133-1371(+)
MASMIHGNNTSGSTSFAARPNLAPVETLPSPSAGGCAFSFAGDKKNISIIGVGRLGLVTALCFEKAGYNVLGVDIFPDYVESINDRTLRSSEPHVEEMLSKAKNLWATCDFDAALSHSDFIFLLVDTPSTGGKRHYDVTKLGRVLTQINNAKVSNKHVIICCTVLPGYIRDIGLHLLRDTTNCTLSYNPEFIAQGAIVTGFLNPDIVLIGEGSKEAGDELEEMYHNICDNKPSIQRMSQSSAEICKISINCYVTMKIAYANTISDIAAKTPGADATEILRAVGHDSRVGTKCLMPGWGFGGPCFPRDNRALAGYAESIGVPPLLARATDASNEVHAQLQAEQLLAEDRKVYEFETVTFKEPCSVPIIEESQKLVVGSIIAKAGKKVVVRDRTEVLNAVRAEYGGIFTYEETA